MFKYILSVLLILGPTVSMAKSKFVPLGMKPGLWEYKTDLGTSDLLEQALANVPKAQRAMVKKMMASKMKTMNKPVQQCLTAEELNDPESHFKKAQKDKDMKDCEMKVAKSTDKFFQGTYTCPSKNYKVKMKITVKSPKKTFTEINMPYPGQPNKKITSVGTWLSTCSKKKK